MIRLANLFFEKRIFILLFQILSHKVKHRNLHSELELNSFFKKSNIQTELECADQGVEVNSAIGTPIKYYGRKLEQCYL
jgi:hypothetical protein